MTALVFHDGLLFSGAKDASVLAWDPVAGEPLIRYSGHDRPISSRAPTDTAHTPLDTACVGGISCACCIPRAYRYHAPIDTARLRISFPLWVLCRCSRVSVASEPLIRYSGHDRPILEPSRLWRISNYNKWVIVRIICILLIHFQLNLFVKSLYNSIEFYDVSFLIKFK